MNACGAEISWALEDVQEWSRMARGKSSDCAGNGELRLALGVQSSLSIKAAYVTTSDTGDERFSATVDSEPHGGYVIAFCDRHSDIKQVKLHILLGGKSKDCEITFK
jgi:hypothetical protein